MRFEKGTIGKLEVEPAERLATALGRAGRNHSTVDPSWVDAKRVMEPPAAGDTTSIEFAARSSTQSEEGWIMSLIVEVAASV